MMNNPKNWKESDSKTRLAWVESEIGELSSKSGVLQRLMKLQYLKSNILADDAIKKAMRRDRVKI